MIRFQRFPKPPDFEERVEKPGETWLASHPDAQRPYDLWSPFRDYIAHGFHHLCAYSAMYEPVGTIDHFVSWNEDRSRAYDWSNLRYASGWINASKSKLPAAIILDPFEVNDDWFELLLPSLQLVVSNDIPTEYRERAEFMLTRLRLSHGEQVMRQRAMWMRMYTEGKLTLAGLEKLAPLLARAIEKQKVTEAIP